MGIDPGDRRAARTVATVRLAALIAVAAAGSFVSDTSGGTEAFFLTAGLVGVPWAIVVLFATEGDGRAVAATAWTGDLLTVFALQTLVPEGGRLALVLSVAVVVVTAYLVRAVSAWAVGAAAVALTFAGHLVSTGDAGAGETALYVAVVVGVCALAERVSGERRRAAAWATHLEGRAAAILDNVADAVVLTDRAGTVRSLNPAARRLIGEAPAEGHCTTVLRLHRNERALDCTTDCALLALTLGDGEGVQLWRPVAGGRRQPLLGNAAVVGGGDVAEVVHSIRDITKLMEADEAKTLFLATASHELKTPLTVINGFATTLLRGSTLDAETRHAAITAIHRRGQELAKIVDRLLMSSRIEAGRLSLELTAVDIASLVAERVTAVRAATGRDVSFERPSGLPPAWAAGDAVATVVDHLVDNALKYTPDGGRVTVVAKARDDEVEIRVMDTGVGMTPEQVERCFEKFWQADGTDARQYGGTGIGLYIVHSLVDAMRGSVAVTSEPGSGTEFAVVLPTRPAEPAVPSQRGADGAEQAGEASMILEFMRQIGVGETRQP